MAEERSGKELVKTRRRLSVVSSNKLIEGVAALALDDEDTESKETASIVAAYAGVTKKGYAPYNPLKQNQDALVMEQEEESGSILLGVLDGHGEAGEKVSGFFKERLPGAVFTHPKFIDEPDVAMKESFLAIEKALLRDASIETEFSGSTAVLSIIRGDDMWVANIGDSRLTLASVGAGRKLKAAAVSIDHKPDSPGEKDRILAAGGRVFAVEYDDGVDGPPRVWLGHMDVPGLAMSRSLGDTVAHSAGVISDAELFTRKLTADDKLIVIATDGLWEFMTDQEVVDMITSVRDPKKAVDLLVAEANARWLREEQVIDDTTVIVAHIRFPDEEAA
eukprot:PLAT4122.1.p1 GENE.PLAT4122.1~~PLAT4122.1.p1  ORF type:complete len:334 (+),score=196.38 PLAT4122.1:30-1031(+)